MARKKGTGPTEKELQILSILWSKGPSTVRNINKVMNRDEDTGYTTTLKLMQIMYEKGLLKRDESEKTHIYTPARPEAHVQEEIVGSLLDRVFSGSTEKLVLRALSSKKVSAEELANIKKMINQKE
jgi:BlaI family transcriptional regulator, penicillinase repressor